MPAKMELKDIEIEDVKLHSIVDNKEKQLFRQSQEEARRI